MAPGGANASFPRLVNVDEDMVIEELEPSGRVEQRLGGASFLDHAGVETDLDAVLAEQRSFDQVLEQALHRRQFQATLEPGFGGGREVNSGDAGELHGQRQPLQPGPHRHRIRGQQPTFLDVQAGIGVGEGQLQRIGRWRATLVEAVDGGGGKQRDAAQLRNRGDPAGQPIQLGRVQAPLAQVAAQPTVGWTQFVAGEVGRLKGMEQLQRSAGEHHPMLGEPVRRANDDVEDGVALVGGDLVKPVEQQGIGTADELLPAGSWHLRCEGDPDIQPIAQYRDWVGTGRARADAAEADQHGLAGFTPAELAEQAALAGAGPADQQQPPVRLQLGAGRLADEQPIGGIERLPLLGGGDLLVADQPHRLIPAVPRWRSQRHVLVGGHRRLATEDPGQVPDEPVAAGRVVHGEGGDAGLADAGQPGGVQPAGPVDQ